MGAEGLSHPLLGCLCGSSWHTQVGQRCLALEVLMGGHVHHGVWGEEAHQEEMMKAGTQPLRDPPSECRSRLSEYEDVDPTSLLVDGHNQDLPAKRKKLTCQGGSLLTKNAS